MANTCIVRTLISTQCVSDIVLSGRYLWRTWKLSELHSATKSIWHPFYLPWFLSIQSIVWVEQSSFLRNTFARFQTSLTELYYLCSRIPCSLTTIALLTEDIELSIHTALSNCPYYLLESGTLPSVLARRSLLTNWLWKCESYSGVLLLSWFLI